MKSYIAKKESIDRKWLLVDAEEQILGRTASRIALILRGKHKPTYTPYVDTGDFVVVINAEKIKVTGKKETDKMYYRHSGYVGHLKKESLGVKREKKPEDILKIAVKGMLPKGPLGRQMLTKLKIYAGAEHPHSAQQPEAIDINTVLNR